MRNSSSFAIDSLTIFEATADRTGGRGYSAKRVLGEDGPVALDIPRDRLGTFEPQLIKKDQRIITLYACGMTVREIQGFVLEQ